MAFLSLWIEAIGIGFRLLLRGQWKNGIKVLIAPIGYWRCRPFATTKQEFKRFSAPTILDIGSPKMLSLLLARHTPRQIFATDLDDPVLFKRWDTSAKAMGLTNYIAQFQDACSLQYPDAVFDLVYSISVIEHIPGEGDSDALREIARVLKPGGVAVIEVPYRRKYETVYQRYSSRGAPLAQAEFYERHYDQAELERRLLSSADGLRVRQVSILGEHLPIDPWIATPRLPKMIRYLLLPMEPLLAAFNYWQRPDDTQGRPLAALIVFDKAFVAK